jgi:hypothetical protein
MKKRFVVPIVNVEDIPSLADEVDRVASEADTALTELHDALEGEGGVKERLTTVELQTESNANNISTAESNIAALQETTSKDLGAVLNIDYDNSAYKLTIKLLNKEGAPLGEAFEIDLPLESVVVNGEYLPTTKTLVLTLQNGNIINIPLGDIIDGLIPSSEKGQPNGVAELNADGVVPESQLPPLDYVKKTGDTMSGGLLVKAAGTVATIAGFGYGITFNGNGYSYGYDGIHTSGENLGYYRFPNIDGMHILAIRSDLEPIQAQLELHSQVIMQSGLAYTADDVNTWNERVTANGLNVLDGSKAVLKKVVGNTVACKQLFIPENIVNFGKNEFATFDETENAYLIPAMGGYYFDKNKYLYEYQGKENTQYTFTADIKQGTAVNIGFVFHYADGTTSNSSNRIQPTEYTRYSATSEAGKTLTAISLNYQTGGSMYFKNARLNEGTADLGYQPYFTGLKSASFGGIESTGKNLVDIANPYSGSSRFWSYSDGVWTGKAPFYQVLWFKFSVKENQSYTISFDHLTSSATNNRIMIQDESGKAVLNTIAQGNRPTVTYNSTYTGTANLTFQSFLDGEDYIFKNLQVEEGTTATEYTPYISPYLFDFPKTEMPLGKTIDFENKKITDYGATIELKGTENIYYSSAIGYGSVFFSALVGEEKDAIGVCTDATIVQKSPSASGEMQIGDGRSGANPVFWRGILAQLGFWASTDDNTTAIASFKSYLAQRYADGNPVTIRYVSSTLQSETDFTADNEYTAYKSGTEKVLSNDNAEFGANNTMTINYVFVREVQQ